MAIGELTASELTNLQSNYLRLGKIEGGKYSLAEVRLELLRRLPSPFGVRESAAKILELAQASSDGLLTYGEFWAAFRPNEPWKGNASVTIVGNALGRVAAYCVDNNLPILTALVVRTSNRRLSPEAISNIYNAAKEWGVEVGSDPAAFVSEQTERSKAVAIAALPAATGV